MIKMQPSQARKIPFMARSLASRDLSIGNIVTAVQCAAGDSTSTPYNGVDKVALEALGMEVACNLQCSVMVAIHSSDDGQPEWRTEVLDRIIRHFRYDRYLRLDGDEIEYVVLVVIVVLLAYEILRQRWASLSEEDQDFIVSAFTEFLDNRDVRAAIKAALDAEHERLVRLDADMDVLNALFVLTDALGEVSVRIEAQDQDHDGPIVAMAEQHRAGGASAIVLDDPLPFSSGLAHGDDSPSPSSSPIISASSADPAQSLSPSFTAYYRDVQAQFFLKPGCSLDFDFVTSANLRGDTLTVETCIGLRMRVEEEVTVSNKSGDLDRVTVQASETGGCVLSATIIIPPGHAYSFGDIVSVEEETELPEWTKVETTKATVWIGNGSYSIQRSTSGTLITVTNVYH
ncbi:hypothetical protein BU26DRAFT_500741 [Trematosphaeria pertusa]|uniref:Uncharacterized protein n=1 Tax=Trematosphaeria pertusa TaxID=390896 RepID=A0A6A6IXT3_9PLEO|nr:uncharacterized protein BU26DRAFT_500741 [Trematosphaeria pertusa]KAF2255118.1 hypothetical protein BU26DRAFT_500741 [Trematosphaeria pertusa]